jgi:plastocyanin
MKGISTVNLTERQLQSVQDIIGRYTAGRIDRRKAIKLLGALGVTAAGLSALGKSAAAHQEMAATPEVGPRADGTNVWKVQVGGMDMETSTDIHSFFPKEITINAGDTIFYQFAPMGMPGAHTVTFTSGEEMPPLFMPDIVDGTPVPSPEGPPRLVLNPALILPDGRTEYDGTGMVNSGVDFLRTPDQPAYQLTFTTPGTYDYACAFHSIVMQGKVTVQEAGAALPADAAAYEAMGQEQFAAFVEEGKAAIAAIGDGASTPAADGSTVYDVAAGAGGLSPARVMSFLPREVTIKAGDTVRWTLQTAGEPHTVTFLGGEEQPEDSLVEPQADGSMKFIQNYQTFMPAGDKEFDGTGYHNSGFLGIPPEIGGQLGLLGDVYELTFTAPGEYAYYCVLHASGPDAEGGMVGKVIVEA